MRVWCVGVRLCAQWDHILSSFGLFHFSSFHTFFFRQIVINFENLSVDKATMIIVTSFEIVWCWRNMYLSDNKQFEISSDVSRFLIKCKKVVEKRDVEITFNLKIIDVFMKSYQSLNELAFMSLLARSLRIFTGQEQKNAKH